jgi:IS6 family transposase
MLSDSCDTRAPCRFLRKVLRTVSDYPPPRITTDKRASCPKAIRRRQGEDLLMENVEHRTSRYLNNIIEADYGTLTRLIRPTRGFQRMATDSVTIKCFEVLRMIRRGHRGLAPRGVIRGIRLVNQPFGLAA